jgi:2'-5' RNA ligase
VRLFVGIPLPALPGVEEVARQLAAVAPSAGLLAPEKWHLTLRFLGEVQDPAPVVDALRRALEDAPRVAGSLVGVGGFPEDRRARVAWAGVRAEGLAEVARRVRAATEGLGAPETRPFVAHLTLARLPHPQDLGRWCARNAGREWGRFAAEAVVLYRSRAGPAGSAYEALARFPLGAAAAPHVPL